MVSNNRKGFTLIELLAVITIIGILLFIAIPAISKIIFNARRNSYVNTAKSMIEDTTRYVKEYEGDYYDGDATYYIDTKCLGGDNANRSPFGKFEEAYVVVGYDSKNAKYEYAWISYDTAGYGVDLVKKDDLARSDVTEGFDGVSVRPLAGKTGSVYMVREDNGCQQVVYEYMDELPIEDLPALMKYSSNFAFWKYKSKIKNITFEDSVNVPEDAVETWDVSAAGDGSLMAYIKNNEVASYYDLWIQGNERIYANPDSSYLFDGFTYLVSIKNLDLLRTIKVTNMSRMFNQAGKNSSAFTLDLGENFDTRNVTNMNYMFNQTGYSSQVFTLDLGNKFDTSKVTNMNYMFNQTGYSSQVFTLDLGNKFDTSNVTNMSYMFNQVGYSSPVFTINLGNNFDTKNVTNMSYMFGEMGYNSRVLTLNLGDKFDTSNVTNMSSMLWYVGNKNPNFTFSLGDKFDTSNVMYMGNLFRGMGYSSTVFTLDLGDKFDTSNVSDMMQMFYRTGYSSPIFTLDLGDKFDTGEVTTMYRMFESVGRVNPNFQLDLGDKFDMSKSSNYMYLFQNNKSSVLYLNKSNLNTSASTYEMFAYTVPVTVYVKSDADKAFLDSKAFSNVTVVVG